MSKPAKKDQVKIKDAQRMRGLTKPELTKELLDCTKDEFKLRMQKATSQLVKSHLIKQVGRRIAKIKTILTEKKHLAAKGT